MTTSAVTPGAGLLWDVAARDYALYRPTYPSSYFHLLQHLGIGVPGQRILDLGAGTGALAVPFAEQGAQVTALDASRGQLDQLELRSRERSLPITTLFAKAEETGLRSHSFEAVTASMCWGYFDQATIGDEVRRLILPGGLVLISSLIWAADDPVSLETNTLLARWNPAYHRNERKNGPNPTPLWCEPPFHLRTFHAYREALWFTRESWRGRIRAAKWIGAALPPDQVEAFDREHAEILERRFPERFPVLHDIALHILQAEG